MRPFRYICLFITVLLCSCQMYFFENPQPLHSKALKAVPAELIGIYKESGSDTLIITNDSYKYLSKDNKKEGAFKLGNMVLKKLDDYYILSQKMVDSLGQPYNELWEVYAMKYTNNHLLVYNLNCAKDDCQPMADSVSRIVPYKNLLMDKDTLHIINPTKNQFRALLDKNLFRLVSEFERIK